MTAITKTIDFASFLLTPEETSKLVAYQKSIASFDENGETLRIPAALISFVEIVFVKRLKLCANLPEFLQQINLQLYQQKLLLLKERDKNG